MQIAFPMKRILSSYIEILKEKKQASQILNSSMLQPKQPEKDKDKPGTKGVKKGIAKGSYSKVTGKSPRNVSNKGTSIHLGLIHKPGLI